MPERTTRLYNYLADTTVSNLFYGHLRGNETIRRAFSYEGMQTELSIDASTLTSKISIKMQGKERTINVDRIFNGFRTQQEGLDILTEKMVAAINCIYRQVQVERNREANGRFGRVLRGNAILDMYFDEYNNIHPINSL